MKRQVMKMITVKNKADVAEIFISGDIVDDSEGGWIEEIRYGNTTGYEFPAKLKAQLDEVKDKSLEIHINSYGGSVFAGVAMANFIAQHKPPTTAIVDGIAASIASQIFFSADECLMPSNAYLMIHRPFSTIGGNADDLRKAADILDTLQDGLESTYRKKALYTVTSADIHEMVNAETWLTGEEATLLFKVKLLAPINAVNCAGYKDKLKAMRLKYIPKALNFSEDTISVEDEDKIKIILARAKGVLI